MKHNIIMVKRRLYHDGMSGWLHIAWKVLMLSGVTALALFAGLELQRLAAPNTRDTILASRSWCLPLVSQYHFSAEILLAIVPASKPSFIMSTTHRRTGYVVIELCTQVLWPYVGVAISRFVCETCEAPES